MSETLGSVVLCFHALRTPLLYWNGFKIEMLLRVNFNFECLCVSSLTKAAPDNSHWHRRFQSTILSDDSLIYHTSRLNFTLFYWSLASQMLFFVLQHGHKEKPCKAAQHLLVYSPLHLTIISSFFMSIRRKNILSVVLGKGGRVFSILLSPVFLSL